MLQEDMRFEVGRIDGRLTSMEDRMNRFEATVQTRLDGIDTKLDTITTAVLGDRGRSIGRQELVRWGIVLISTFGFLGSWLLSRIGGGAGH